MTPPDHVPKLGTREHFLQVSQLQRWGTIQEYVDLCRMHGYFTPEFYATAIAHMERIHMRRMLRQVTDGRGWPTVANIIREGHDGRPERVFMQEELFGSEEQTTSRFPFRWCGMKPTVSGKSQLDEPPEPHCVQEKALDASELRYANPRG